MLCEFTSSMIFSKRRLLNSIFIFCFQITFLFLYMYISHKQKHLFTQQLILFLFIFNQIQFSHNKRVTFASVQIVLIVSFVCATNIASLRLGFGWLLVGAARLAGFVISAVYLHCWHWIALLPTQLYVALKLSQNLAGNSFWVSEATCCFSGMTARNFTGIQWIKMLLT